MKRTSLFRSSFLLALMLALTVRLYKSYHTFNLDEIYRKARKEQK